MMNLQEDFNTILRERRPLSSILGDDKLECIYRHLLRSRNNDLIEYLKSPEILSEIIDYLINEEGKSFQDPSESLTIILSDIDPITDTVTSTYLNSLYSYLDKDKHQPRRVYFFLRVMSFLFQNRSIEMFSYVNDNPNVIRKLVNHIKSPHILQLLLNMLSVERQLKGFVIDMPNSSWSENCELISKVVEVLEHNPEENLEAVQKFFSEVCLSYPSDSDFIKNILLIQDAALIRSVLGLMDNKNTVADAVKLLDQVILVILTDNKSNEEFFAVATNQLKAKKDIFHNLLESDSLIMALAGTKLVQTLVKHQLTDLLSDGTLSCLKLLTKFKWSNVLHTVVCDILVNIFKTPFSSLITPLLDEGDLVNTIITTFETEEEVGYRGHLRIVANAIRDCPDPMIASKLSSNTRWNHFLAKLDQLNENNIGYREAETRRRDLMMRRDNTNGTHPVIQMPVNYVPPINTSTTPRPQSSSLEKAFDDLSLTKNHSQ